MREKVYTVQLYRQHHPVAPCLWRDVADICSYGTLGLLVCAIVKEVLR